MEIWKNIEGINVSNLGNVQGETRSHNGYLEVVGYSHKYVHILVGKAFCGWFDGCNVHHINGDKYDNRAENIECLTPSEHQDRHREQKAEISSTLFLGKHHTEESKEKMRKWHTGKVLSDEHKQRIKEASHTKRVAEYDLDGNLIKVWDSVHDAEKQYNCYHISECCKGKRKTASKRIWRYYGTTD